VAASNDIQFHDEISRNMSGKLNQQKVFAVSTRIRPLSDEAAKFRTVSLLWLAGISLLLVPMASLIDVPIARWFSHDPLSRELGDVLDLSLIYAHGSGIFLILVSIVLLAPKCRWHVPRLATLAMGGGAVATLTKMFILRPRPNSLRLESATYDYAWIWSFDGTLSQVADFDASTRAFPSAYLATATALTVGLWVVLPRGRWLFAALCAGTMLQRLYCGSHFVSDLFGSAAVGLGWSYVCYHPRLMGTLFDKMEPEQKPRRRRWEDKQQHEPGSKSTGEETKHAA
jgi:membrane-associated phospholipid phosphatase